jgi:hypothetical protein
MTRARHTSENARQAKAWVNFNGQDTNSEYTEANGAIRDSFNVSSVTNIGTGHYDVNFEESFADTNYAWAGGAGDTGLTTAVGTPNSVRTGQMSTDKIRISVCYANTSANAVWDYELVTLIVFGEQ